MFMKNEIAAEALIAKAINAGLIEEDPHWLERLDEPVPMRVLLECMLRMLERLEPTDGPYD